MAPEDLRLAIAEALAAQRINQDWAFSADNSVPATARAYSVYDGTQLIGAGITVARAADLVARCAMPIVFYQEGK